MAVSGGFDSATGLSTGDNLDHALATSRDAAQLTPNLRDDPDAGGQIRSAAHRPTPGLRDDPDAGGQIHSAVQPFAGGEHQLAPPDIASASDQLVMRGVTPQLVQAMASFFAAGAADSSRSLSLGAEPPQQPFLATPQHA
jgi:hypothetical protein